MISVKQAEKKFNDADDMGLKERKEREKLQRRKDILDAAQSLIIEKGYQNITIRQIADIAELGVGTIYSYFKNKEDIYAVLSEEIFDIIYLNFAEASENDRDPVRKIRSIAEKMFELSETHKAFYDFIDYFISTPQVIFPMDIKNDVDFYGKKILEPIIEALSLGIKSGNFIEVDTRNYALIFLGNMHGCLHFKKLKSTLLKDEDFDNLYSSCIDCFINGIKREI